MRYLTWHLYLFIGSSTWHLGPLFPGRGLNPRSPALEGQSFNHWTTGTSLLHCILSCNLSTFTLATLQVLEVL